MHTRASADICIRLWFPYSIRTIKTNFLEFCFNVIPFEFPAIGNTLEISMVEGTLPPFNIGLKFLCDKTVYPYLCNLK